MASLENLLNLLLMSKVNATNAGKRCPSCQNKEGNLFVLPTRLSIGGMIKKEDIPQLPKFALEKVEDLPLKHSQYCLQILRQGYLYVLEHRVEGKKWRVFTSSPEGCLIEHRDPKRVSNVPPTYTCNIDLEGADASYIAFKQSESIIKIYFIFSPDKIEYSKLDFYQDEGLYLLDGATPDEIRKGTKSLLPDDFFPHILEFSVAENLARQEQILNSKLSHEFKSGERDPAFTQKQKIRYLYQTRTLFHDQNLLKPGQYCDNNFLRYLSLYKKLKKRQGAAIVVNDPIGITQSLNNRRHDALQRKMKVWMQTKDSEKISNEHRLIILNELDSLKASFREKRLVQMMKKHKEHGDLLELYNKRYSLNEQYQVMSNSTYRRAYEPYVDSINKDYTSEIAEQEFEQKYWSRLSQPKIDQFRQEFEKNTKQAEQLAESRSQDLKIWLLSEQLLKALDHYDQDSKVQGVKFSLQVNICLFGVSSSPILRDVLDNWWSAQQIKRNNLCWRSYLYNNQIIIDEVNRYIQHQDSVSIQGEFDSSGSMPELTTVIDLLEKITGHLSEVNTVSDIISRSGFPVAFLSVSLSDLMRRFLHLTTTSGEQAIKNRLGNLILSSIDREARNMYRLGYNINGKNFNSYAPRAVPQINRVARTNLENSDLVNSRIATLLFLFNGFLAINKLMSDKPLGTREKAELTASIVTTTAAAFQVGISYIEATVGNNPNSRTAIVTYNAFGRIFLWGASLSAIAGSMSAVFDSMDVYRQFVKRNGVLAIAYFTRAGATLALSISQFLTAFATITPWLQRILAESTRRTLWIAFVELGLFLGRFALLASVEATLSMINVYATLIIAFLTVIILILDDNALQKWFDRCCFSKQQEREIFNDLGEELTEFHQVIQGSF